MEALKPHGLHEWHGAKDEAVRVNGSCRFV